MTTFTHLIIVKLKNTALPCKVLKQKCLQRFLTMIVDLVVSLCCSFYFNVNVLTCTIFLQLTVLVV